MFCSVFRQKEAKQVMERHQLLYMMAPSMQVLSGRFIDAAKPVPARYSTLFPRDDPQMAWPMISEFLMYYLRIVRSRF